MPHGCQPRSDLRSRPWVLDHTTLLRRPPWTWEGARPGLVGGRLTRRCGVGGGRSPHPGAHRSRGVVDETSGGRAPWAAARLGKNANILTPPPPVGPRLGPRRTCRGPIGRSSTASVTISAGTRQRWASPGAGAARAGGSGWAARWRSSSEGGAVITAASCAAAPCGAARVALRRSERRGRGMCSASWPGTSRPLASRVRSSSR
jgi:hypothetical protein